MKNSKPACRLAFVGLFIAIVATLFASVVKAEPLTTGWLKNPNHPPVETRFVISGQVDVESKTVAGFLEVRLAGDWKTYWRSPGEGGIAPSMTWDGSKNLSDIVWHWPHPKRFELLGIETLGYKGNVIFPMTLHVDDLDSPVVLDANLTLSSCTTVCVLTDYPFEISFIPSELKLSESAMHTYAQGMSLVPKPSPLIKNVNAVWDEQNSKLQVTVENSMGWTEPDMLIDGTTEEVRDSAFTQPVFEVEGNKLVATFDVTNWMGTPQLDEQTITVTLDDNNFIAEHATTVKSQMIIEDRGNFNIAQMILFALFGGFILNIMPCVLPVLGMKLSSIVSTQGLEKRQIRFQFLSSSLGILVSFWLIALFLTVLKLSGSAIGWGIQFQNAWFIGLMVFITGVFGANMLGLFEIRLSSNANTWLATKGDNSYKGHFTQGMFATLLATPCSAPFLGTAVAFALATSIPVMFLIFTALALGMASPWIVVALFPSVALRLPKPGQWMNKIKLLFGFMMLITSVWLLSLLSNHVPMLWVYVISIVALALLVMRTLRVYGKKVATWTGGALIILASASLVVGSITSNKSATLLPPEPNWEPLSTTAIENHIADGKVVFVNVTADWCITCKANKIGVLLQDPVYGMLHHSDVVAMEGDWTVPSQSVTSYLQENGRFGVPFNIVYGPKAPNGIPLPIILTDESVISAIETANGNNKE
ncbi:protein-disulfide reductase DsbD family protein [Vibrio cyclitrophicus]|uniref:protein-disulfide reductase DsbD family protein n=1 Tax=Vibrio cyclitrophicus TaxID=47951 RepID=UPI0002DC6A44|nr:protein-disulfide reductase DsbD domain-containing protein [Vibrio cyclitrophicus]OCH40471.1 cytochrome C biogenesis protein [Vibrio cyclitrophicus]OED87098.1 cytochrome C biogenesis protein [Vibrio cyclitrophicus ZF30]OEF39322.1 cytochrome C biogenesis protein [Vibrio cyclitrophicus 1F289]PMO06946.1 cytochrome C biogenesis protein [Vibrio cyclitrophicus]PMP54515.1 cytochrome C biogenesis protein [Vibrio cyclitrophicus]